MPPPTGRPALASLTHRAKPKAAEPPRAKPSSEPSPAFAPAPAPPAPSSPGGGYGPIESDEDLQAYLTWANAQQEAPGPLAPSPLYALPPYRPSHRFSPPPAPAAVAGAAAALGSLPAALARFSPGSDVELLRDRVREWLAALVLQPLLAELRQSHERVAFACARVPNGLLDAISRPPCLLPDAATEQSAALRHRAALAARLAGRGRHAPAASDDGDAAESATREYGLAIGSHLQQASLPAAERAAFLGALGAVTTHLALISLLRGGSPSGLLTSLPPGYVASRVAALAEGSCLAAFDWAGGGEWPPGKKWSAELPDDSALLFYVVAAFLQAPGWSLSTQHAGLPHASTQQHCATSHGVQLFVGQLPAASRAPERYAAMLCAPLRPPDGDGGAFALSLASRGVGAPRFHAFAEGGELCCVGGPHGLFDSLALFFAVALARGGGGLGPSRLDGKAVSVSAIFEEPGSRL